MIKNYKLSGYSYEQFCGSFKENIIERRNFDKGFYNYCVFNINNTTLTLMQEGTSSEKKLTIGLDEELINKTINEIKSKGFKLEEITK